MTPSIIHKGQLLDRWETKRPTVLIVVGEAGQGETVQGSPEEVNEVFQRAGGTWWVSAYMAEDQRVKIIPKAEPC